MIRSSVNPRKTTSLFPTHSTFCLPRSPIVIVSRPGGGEPQIIYSPTPIVSHLTRRAAVANPSVTLMAIRLHYRRTVKVAARGTNRIYCTTLALCILDSPSGANCARVDRLGEELQGDSDGTGGPCGSGGVEPG